MMVFGEAQIKRKREMGKGEEIEMVIIGGGICGLATSLALHRKGIRSVVLERSETLRSTGAAIGVFPNGWRALHQLGLGSALQSNAIPFLRGRDVWIDKGTMRETPLSEGVACCIKRNDLIEALANELPSGTIRFGSQVLSVHAENSSSDTTLQLSDGSLIKAKVLIGCDGAHSIVADFIGLKPTRLFSESAVRGLSIYPEGHGFTPEFLRMRKDQHLVGRIPIDEKTVYWFTVMDGIQRDADMPKDPSTIKALTLDATSSFSSEVLDMINNSDLNSLSFTHLRYRAPWDLLLGNFRKGNATVAGDAWHIMCPFLGQGGSAALEDAVVLARCLSKKAYSNENGTILSENKVKEALDAYLKERKTRIVLLSTLTHIRGLLLVGDPSLIVRLLCIVIIMVLFRDPLKHMRYDCGKL